jgi:hypothetical protein
VLLKLTNEPVPFSNDLAGGKMGSAWTFDPATLDLFKGASGTMFDLPISAVGAYSAVGLDTNLEVTPFANASSIYSVTYQYSEIIPEPTCAVLLLLGGTGLLFRRRR